MRRRSQKCIDSQICRENKIALQLCVHIFVLCFVYSSKLLRIADLYWYKCWLKCENTPRLETNKLNESTGAVKIRKGLPILRLRSFCPLLFCVTLCNIETKPSTQREPLFYPMFANCVHDVRSRFWTWIFFSPNRKKFAVECDWNSEISQNIQNLELFSKKRRVFRKWTWFFFQNC